MIFTVENEREIENDENVYLQADGVSFKKKCTLYSVQTFLNTLIPFLIQPSYSISFLWVSIILSSILSYSYASDYESLSLSVCHKVQTCYFGVYSLVYFTFAFNELITMKTLKKFKKGNS